MVYFQQSLFGKMSWERFHQMTGWILEPSYPLSQTPMFQCLLLEDGQEPEWCEGERLTSAGGSWTPSIGQAPGWHDGSASFLWQTLEDGVPTKYFLSPAQCSHFLHLAEIAGCPPPAEIEALLLKQGGAYQSPNHFRFPTETECERLMGLPEGWTRYGADGEEILSSHRYRALGNAIALPCAEYIMAGIAEALTKGGANDGI